MKPKRYKVRGWVEYRAYVQQEVIVEAQSPEEAARKVLKDGTFARVSDDDILDAIEFNEAGIEKVEPVG